MPLGNRMRDRTSTFSMCKHEAPQCTRVDVEVPSGLTKREPGQIHIPRLVQCFGRCDCRAKMRMISHVFEGMDCLLPFYNEIRKHPPQHLPHGISRTYVQLISRQPMTSCRCCVLQASHDASIKEEISHCIKNEVIASSLDNRKHDYAMSQLAPDRNAAFPIKKPRNVRPVYYWCRHV
jgi:hypothetical protein